MKSLQIRLKEIEDKLFDIKEEIRYLNDRVKETQADLEDKLDELERYKEELEAIEEEITKKGSIKIKKRTYFRDPRKSKKIERFILNEIQDLGYSIENSEVREVFESALEFAELASKEELKNYIEGSLELIPSRFLQGDSL